MPRSQAFDGQENSSSRHHRFNSRFAPHVSIASPLDHLTLSYSDPGRVPDVPDKRD
jgi:hypothetical protein